MHATATIIRVWGTQMHPAVGGREVPSPPPTTIYDRQGSLAFSARLAATCRARARSARRRTPKTRRATQYFHPSTWPRRSTRRSLIHTRSHLLAPVCVYRAVAPTMLAVFAASAIAFNAPLGSVVHAPRVATPYVSMMAEKNKMGPSGRFWERPDVVQSLMETDSGPKSNLGPSPQLKDPIGRFWETNKNTGPAPKQVLGAACYVEGQDKREKN